ncbi:DUF802 domain-containing protein [Haliea sp. E17]|uniref:DUF802 domain-containing protein n=1 Tax=Haliea sp. E17 TaxID=3401576 RepID=UPI003AAED07C
MKRFLFAVPFAAGALAIVWIATRFLDNPIALAVTLVIAAGYSLGLLELLAFRRNTARLEAELDTPPDSRDALGDWLQALPVSLRHSVQRRIDGHPAPLPGPVLTPYLTGLLVMLGLLGTFVGMIVTLQGAATALNGSSELAAIRSALSAPIAGLSLAFGTSIAGVAASAMLGLSATLCRRDRLLVSRRLDNLCDSALHPFSMDHQRAAAYAALHQQTAAFPALVEALQGLTGRMEQLGSELRDTLTDNQRSFHASVQDQYQQLAQSVAQSLDSTLAASSRLAVENIQPLMAQSIASLSQQVEGTHQRLVDLSEQQLGQLTRQFRETTESAADHWRSGLDTHQQTSARLVEDFSTSLREHQASFRADGEQLVSSLRDAQQALAEDSSRQLQAVSEQFRQSSEDSLQHWMEQLASQQDASQAALQQANALQQQQAEQQRHQLEAATAHYSAAVEQAASQWLDQGRQQHAASGELAQLLRSAIAEHSLQFETGAAALLDSQRQGLGELLAALRGELSALRDAEAERGAAASDRLAGLEGTVAEHLGRLGSALEAPMTRLIETASETPKAAAEVISRLNEEMARNSQRDNQLLEERQRIMLELDALLSEQRATAAAQRDAIETLVTRTGETLSQVGATFNQQVSAQGGRLNEMAGDLSGSAAEVASLSDAFGAAVQVFSESNDKLLDNLQQVEAALEKSAARADEQLAYYVEQAREVIELSMTSQAEVINALGALPGRDGTQAGAG